MKKEDARKLSGVEQHQLRKEILLAGSFLIGRLTPRQELSRERWRNGGAEYGIPTTNTNR